MLVPKESIRKMEPYAGPAEGRMAFLRLDFNENLLGASPKVLEAIARVSREQYGCYPEYGDLTKALCTYFGIAEGCALPTNGSDEAIRAIFDTYVEKGDEVILLTPSYSMYELYAQIVGASIVWVPYAEDFSFPLESVLEAIGPKTRLIALACPNNPTGTFIEREALVEIIEANPKMAVLVDEAYGSYARKTNVELAMNYPNVLVTQTFSKAHGLAGLRIGCLIARKDNIETVSKVLSSAYSVDCLAVVAAIAAMQDAEYVNAYVDTVIATREYFQKEVSGMGFKVVPSQANFVMIHFGQQAEAIQEALALQHILVREKSDLKGFLRVTIGPCEQMDRVLAVLRNFCPKAALVFDMDGVLVDESKSYRQCILKTLQHFVGREIDPALVEERKKKGGFNNDYDCVASILKDQGLEIDMEAIIECFDGYYQQYKNAERWLVDKLLLAKLKQRFRLGVFTGRPRRDALDALKRFGMDQVFEVVTTDDDVKNRKPDPEGLLLTISQLLASKAVYFGDSVDDQQAALRAGVEFIEIESPGQGIDGILERMLCQKEM